MRPVASVWIYGLILLGGCETKRPPAPNVSQPQDVGAPRVERQAHFKSAADAKCGDCHADIVAAYSKHPMGRSLAKAAAADPLETYGAEAHLPCADGAYHYEVSLAGDRMIHRERRFNAAGESVTASERPIAYAVGSGRRGRSYLIQDHDRLFMSPLTYYPPHQRWDLSPGYERNNSHFFRPIVGGCLFCHAGETTFDDDSLNYYPSPAFAQESIGCHRCHGPGETHVTKQSAGAASGPDDSIINPARLTGDLALDVCAQCHLSGAARVIAPGKGLHDFVPGERLRDSVAIYVERRDKSDRFVSHVEQMKESRCFLGSEGALRCTSCHDPHRAPEEATKVDFYRERCAKCHADRGCSAPAVDRQATTPADNCLTCHMPALSTEIRHAAVSDHRIPRRPIADEPPEEKPLGLARLTPFDRTALDDPNYPLARNAGLALLMAIDAHDREPRPEDVAAAARNLEEVIQASPEDNVAREGLGAAYLRLNEPAAALAHFEHILRDHPDREFSISGAARAAFAVKRFELAADYWRSVAERNPALPLYTTELARSLGEQRAWEACRAVSTAGLQRFPENFVLRRYAVESALGLRDFAAADVEFAEFLKLEPPGAAEIRFWYEDHPLRKSRPQ